MFLGENWNKSVCLYTCLSVRPCVCPFVYKTLVILCRELIRQFGGY